MSKQVQNSWCHTMQSGLRFDILHIWDHILHIWPLLTPQEVSRFQTAPKRSCMFLAVNLKTRRQKLDMKTEEVGLNFSWLQNQNPKPKTMIEAAFLIGWPAPAITTSGQIARFDLVAILEPLCILVQCSVFSLWKIETIRFDSDVARCGYLLPACP